MGVFYDIINLDLNEYIQTNCKRGELAGNWNLWMEFLRLLDGRWKGCKIELFPEMGMDGYYDNWTKIEIEHEDYKYSGILTLVDERVELIEQRQMLEGHFKPCKKMMNFEAKREVQIIIEEVKRRGID